MNSGNEAAAVAFFNYKRTDGFEVSLTLRGDTGTQVLERIETAIAKVIKDGGVPAQKYIRFDPKPIEKPKKPCPVHPGAMLTEKQSKNGSGTYWSHYIGTFPNGQSCYGKAPYTESFTEPSRQVDDVNF